MTNNDDTFRWDCIKGTRAIKDKIDAEIATMTWSELQEYLHNAHIEFTEYITSVRAKEGIVL
ncbi:MAG: hypothetical protein FWF51_08080 [Chitinivibrionia bacterium]|nr:hypothetical protein [Chitinivibrionia bacterium]